MFVLLCVYLSGMIGCATKESGAEKVSNDTQIVANMKEIVTIIGEVETQKKNRQRNLLQQLRSQVASQVINQVQVRPIRCRRSIRIILRSIV